MLVYQRVNVVAKSIWPYRGKKIHMFAAEKIPDSLVENLRNCDDFESQ
jgi:hypothetical protein